MKNFDFINLGYNNPGSRNGDQVRIKTKSERKATEKIDGAVANIMALDRVIRCGEDKSESVHDIIREDYW